MLERWKFDAVLSGFLAMVVVLLAFLPVARELDNRITDFYFRLQPSRPSSNVVIVAIDDASLQKIGRWPWNRRSLARLIERVSAQKPKVIGVDVLLSEPQDRDSDAALAGALKSAGNIVLVDKIAAFADGPHWVEPLPAFATSAVAVGHAQAVLDQDGICRRFPPEQLSLAGIRNAFAIEVARIASPERANKFLRQYGMHVSMESDRVVIARPLLIPIFFSKDHPATISAAEFLENNPSTDLEGKVVLIGFGPSELGDRITTPVSEKSPTPGVEIHAQIVQTVLAVRPLRGIPLWKLGVLALLQSLGCLQLIRVSRGWMTVPAVLAVSLAVVAAGWLAFHAAGIIIPAGSLLCGAFLTPVTLYGVELAAVEKSVSRQMHSLAKWFYPRGELHPHRDLTWRVRLLAKLQEQLGERFEFFSTLLEATNDLVAVFDSEGTLLFHNQAFSSAWWPNVPSNLTEFRGRIVESKVVPMVFAEQCVQGEACVAETLYSVRLVPLPKTSLVPNGGTLLSMTSLAMRVERDNARDEALHFVTHELRTPLSAIHSFAELMLQYPGSETSAKAPETILRESDRLLLLINSYLDVLRTDSGARALHRTPVLLTSVVERVLETLAPLAQSHGIRLRFNCSTAFWVPGDEPLLTGAVLNLVTNAIKYGDRESEVLVSVLQADGQLELRVRNMGMVLTAYEIGRIFDPFVRGAGAESSRQGSGLGLSIVKRIVEKHAGTIDVKSTASGETTFALRLPTAQTEIGAMA